MATRQKHNSDQAQETAHKRRTVRPMQQETALGLMRQPDLAVLQRAVADPGRAAPGDILALQRAYGNRAVTRLIQTKLTVGPVGDRYEREADRVAERVMSMLTPARERGGRGEGETALRRQVGEEEELQMQPLAASITPIVQRQLDEEDEIQMQPLVQRQLDEEDEIQMKPLVQRQLDEEDEIQMKPLVQRQLDEEDEIQMKPLVQRQLDEEDEIQMKPLVQRQLDEEDEIQMKPLVQRQLDEEDEIQMKPLVQRQLDEEDEMQMQPLVQRQLDEEDEMQMQPLVQRQLDEEDEIQMKPLVQRQLDEEDEIQMKPLVQRQLDEEDEIQMQPLVQRQAGEERGFQDINGSEGIAQRQLDEEDEMQMQPLVQRQLDEEDEIQMQPLVQRQLDEEDEMQMQPLVQRRADGGFEAGHSLERRLTAHKGGGSPLPDETRTFMEPRFGADFSDVRVHTGNEATGMNKDLRSRAFTHGRDIYFGSGKYDSGTGAGKRLLAHELTHVIQQSGKNDRIARWGGLADNATGHDEVTADAFEKIRDTGTGKTGFSQGAQEYVKHHSESMDLRAGFLAMVIGATVYQKALSRMAKDKDAYDEMQGYWRSSDEAPNHAEGGQYKSDNGAARDIARVDLNLEKAIVAWDKNNPSQSLSMLGLAVHTAEDRGAHGDGAPGTGHDPRRVVRPPAGATKAHLYEGPDWKGSDCDSKSKNPAGYAFSVVQAVDVLTRFRTAVKNKNKKTRLEEYKKPGGLLTKWRSGKILVGSGHTNLKWDRDWKGKKGLMKKTGAVIGASPALALKYGYKGGKGGLKMGHRTARQIWKGRVGGKGGLAGRIKRGWGGFGKRVSSTFGDYTGRMGERFGRARGNYEQEMYEANQERGGRGHKRRWKKLLAKTKYGAKFMGRTIQGGLGYARRGLTTGVGAVLGAGATVLGAGLGTAGSLASYGVGGGVGLAGGLAGGALRGAFEYTGRPLWALGKPFRALGRKMRGRKAGKGYEVRPLLDVATAIGCRVEQTLGLIRFDYLYPEKVKAMAQALERFDKDQRQAFTTLTREKLELLLPRLDQKTLQNFYKLTAEQISKVGPKTIDDVSDWVDLSVKTLKEEEDLFESILHFGFSLPQLTALGKLGPDRMKALSAGLKELDKDRRNAFTSLKPHQLKMLAQFNTNQITVLFEGIKDLHKYQFNAFVEFDRLKSLAQFSSDKLTALLKGIKDLYKHQFYAFVELDSDRLEALAQFSPGNLTALLKVIKGLDTRQIMAFMDLEAEEIASMSKKRIKTIKRKLMV